MRLNKLLASYIQWTDRFIAARPRQVFAWDGFAKHSLPIWDQQKFQELIAKIEAGADLTPYLSKKVQTGYVQPNDIDPKKKNSTQWKDDKDYALNAYDIHHLHLTPKGTRELAYINFSREEAFVVMIGDHKSFDDGKLADALADARLDTPLEMMGVHGANDMTTKELNKLQRHGLSTCFNVGGRVVLGAVLSSAGTSIWHTRHADILATMIEQTDPQLDEHDFGEALFSDHGLPFPESPQFEWEMSHCDLWLTETTTDSVFSVERWKR